VSSSFDVAAWTDFAVAVAGATAALAGLLFVAMSINVREIVADPALPPRAGGAVITLVTPLVCSILLLVPGQSDTVLGIELLVVGAAIGTALGTLLRRRSDAQGLATWAVGTGLPTALLVGSVLLAGFGVLTETLGGLHWLVVATIAAIAGGLLQAWVLLIEILR
jgi:modulator of FtsH protease